MKKFVLAVLTAATLIFSGNVIYADDESTSGSFTYPIKPGSNLSTIARDFGVSKNALVEANKENKHVKTPDLILSGGRINVPNVFTQKDVEEIKKADAVQLEAVLRETEEKHKAENAKSGIVITLLMVASVVFFVLMFKYIFKYLDEKEALASVKVKLALAEMDIDRLRDSDKKKSEIIAKKDINLQLNQEQINALLLAKKEAESRRNELLEAYKRIDGLESDLKNRYAKGDKVKLRSQELGELEFTVNKVDVFVDCPAEKCLVNSTKTLKMTNALSHYFNGHSNTQPEVCRNAEPKEVNSSAKAEEVSNGGIPD